jgi:hypothetical protein
MKRGASVIDRDPEVQGIAKGLKITGGDLKAKLCAAAVERVAREMERYGIVPETLDDVHSLVLNMTGVRVERIADETDLVRVSKTHRKRHAAIGVQLELEFAKNTEALVFRDEGADARQPTFTAVIDARGERSFRAWFAERHEPAHLLIPDPSGKLAWRRTTEDRPEPVEQVVDAIASQVGFWEPLVRPALALALTTGASVFEAFEAVRRDLAPNASMEASYRALTRLVEFPLVVLRTDLGCRRSDPKNEQGTLALRATTLIWNEAAERAGITVWQNFRIPSHSVIHEAREDVRDVTRVQDDDLNAWRTESGQRLVKRSLPVRVTARGRWATIEVGA